jgi:hypothetical protein
MEEEWHFVPFVVDGLWSKASGATFNGNGEVRFKVQGC